MEEENDLIAQRRSKMEALRARNIEPFGAAFEVTGSIADVRANPEDAAPVVFRAEQNVLLELAEPATSAVSTATPGWVKVRHRDGQTGFIRVAQVFGL